ncbi:MAG: hypothetical protein ACOCZT_02910 [Halanaerobiales bacterium]
MSDEIIVKCYCQREWHLGHNNAIACAVCGFIMKKKISKEKEILVIKKPIFRKKIILHKDKEMI